MAYSDFYNIFAGSIANSLGISVGAAIVLLTIIGLWSLMWKGLALWKSSKRNQLVWFVVLLVINTVGILEILYIFVFSELGRKPRQGSQPKRKALIRHSRKTRKR